MNSKFTAQRNFPKAREIGLFFLLLAFGCKTPLPELSSEEKLSQKKIISIRWNTSDPILAKVFAEVFPVPPGIVSDSDSRPNFTAANLPEPDPKFQPKPKPQKEISDELQLPKWERKFELTQIDNLTFVIRKESQRPLYSLGVSILFLTMVYYGTMESESELVWTAGEDRLHRISFLSAKETIWAPMPFYIGTGSTLVSPVLNANRYPTNLQKYCIESKPSRMREFMEQTADKNCEEYALFLKRVFLENYSQIHKQLLEWESRNQDWFIP